MAAKIEPAAEEQAVEQPTRGRLAGRGRFLVLAVLVVGAGPAGPFVAPFFTRGLRGGGRGGCGPPPIHGFRGLSRKEEEC